MVRKATTDLEVSVSPVQCVKAFRKLIEEMGGRLNAMKVQDLSIDSP